MKKSIVLMLLSGLLAACSSNQHATHETSSRNGKASVETLMNAINSRDAAAAEAILHPDYEQHNPFIADKAEGLLNLFPVIEAQNIQVSTVLLLEDGEYTVALNQWHNAEAFGHGCNEMVAFDFFSVNTDGRLAGHWDAMQCESEPNASGRRLTDGITAITDLDQTEANKSKLKQAFDIFINGTLEEAGAALQTYFHPDYKQHNPDAADGIEGFFAAQMSGKVKPRWVFEKQHIVVGEGNYVLSIAEGQHLGVHSIFYDLVRFENGKIAEHWDVIQAIPTEGLANDNTMFGF
ncbi:nuclear transport factor 2 family protein [Ostreibacterium oceani]|uniref:SnoaL-like domain-containing protein n=1 Tax=Ostreibacterium oceani TaxID=2654998 RepID=A0A6N7EUL2_9GAMM|nr:nuclear transport factor 2 family protein [Ostreibacterium oceani]MPV86251.1 hypothetical protein [Ostreibacterium oceani]